MPTWMPVTGPVATSSSAEIKRLKAENRQLCKDNEILKADDGS